MSKTSLEDLKRYAEAWRGGWVVIANIPTSKVAIHRIQAKYDLDNPDHWAPYDQELQDYRALKCNMSADFDTHEEAVEYAVEVVKAGATYLTICSPEVYAWALDDAMKTNPAVRLAGEKIQWLSSGKVAQ